VFDSETNFFVNKVSIEFNNVSKTGLRTKIRQRLLEIYYFSHPNPHKLEILGVSKIEPFLHYYFLNFMRWAYG
jgi:hypothetical protein